MQRGGVYWIDWNPARGSEQAGHRPGLVVQNDIANGNPNYPNTIVAAMSRQGRDIPVHVRVEPTPGNQLPQAGYVKCEQVMTIAKARLGDKIGQLEAADMEAVDAALQRSLGLA